MWQKQQIQQVEPNEFDALMGFDNPEGDVTNEEEGDESEGEGDDEGDENPDDDDSDDSDDDGDNDDAADSKDTQIRMLTEQNAKLLSMFNELQDQKKQKDDVVSKFVDPLESEAFTSLAETMNWDSEEIEKFKGFFKSYADYVSTTTAQSVLDKTPDVVSKSMSRQQQRDKIATDFYSNNPELSGVREYVKAVASGVIGEMGEDTPLEKVLAETAKRAYKALGLKRKKTAPGGEKGEKAKTPAFPQQKGVRQKPPKKDKAVSDIDKLLDGVI